ncbi:MAG: NAD(+) synthase [Emergencia sp.]
MYEFDAESVKNQVVEWIRGFFEENGKDCKAVVAVSGGKDSSVVAALCAEALGKDRVFGVLLPNGEQADIDASRLLVSHLGIDHCVINIKDSFDGMMDQLASQMPVDVTKQTRTNLPARLRMAATYAVAQSMNGRVANTCNLSEDWVGYATRYGDGAGDFSPLSRLTVQEVKAVGRELGLPEKLVEKTPIDGLSGLTDEENLGFTYAVLDKYIRTGVCEDAETKAKIDQKRKMNRFKLELMPFFDYDGPVKAAD